MKLSAWLKKKGMSQREFAQLIGSDQGHVSDLVRGKNFPRVVSITKIERATKGAVKFEDWVNGSRRRR